MRREIIPPPARDELDPSWTASTAAADRLTEANAYARQGLIVGEAANKVAQLYAQEVRQLQQAGQPVPTFDDFVRDRAALRIQQGYTPLIPDEPAPAKPSLFRRWFGWG